MDRLMIFNAAWLEQKKKKITINFNEAKKIAWIGIIILLLAIPLSREKKSINLKTRIKMSTFQLNLVKAEYLKNLELLNLEVYVLREMGMMF